MTKCWHETITEPSELEEQMRNGLRNPCLPWLPGNKDPQAFFIGTAFIEAIRVGNAAPDEWLRNPESAWAS